MVLTLPSLPLLSLRPNNLREVLGTSTCPRLLPDHVQTIFSPRALLYQRHGSGDDVRARCDVPQRLEILTGVLCRVVGLAFLPSEDTPQEGGVEALRR